MITSVESTAEGRPHRGAVWRRLLRHLLTTPYSVRRDFPPPVLRAIGAAIELAEAGHTGEIVFVAEGSLPWPLLRRNATPRRRALALFAELRAWDTEHNNGVLVYLGLADRAVEIVADRGIAGKVPAATWHELCQQLRDACREGRYEEGAVACVRALGELQRAHFALRPGQVRHNELPDRPLVL
jgi:uncharacterized membrane protein